MHFNSCLSADYQQVFVGTWCALVPCDRSAASKEQRWGEAGREGCSVRHSQLELECPPPRGDPHLAGRLGQAVSLALRRVGSHIACVLSPHTARVPKPNVPEKGPGRSMSPW